MKRSAAFVTALLMTGAALTSPLGSIGNTLAAGGNDMNITVDLKGDRKEISPLIYGINQYTTALKDVKATAVRQGGNRMTAYNWETNASNAGSDWKHSSDTNISSSTAPADAVQTLSKTAAQYGVGYKMTTLQLAGYVSADINGTVTEEETAPSDRWNKVVFTKNAPFADEPDLTDGVVYMDEYVNYIINKLGDSTSPTGIQGYSLDNEPVLWDNTHPRVHPDPVTIEELASKSVEVAKNVKKLDPNAEIYGPALYGYTAYDHLDDDENSDEWETIKSKNNYHWYLDCYLDDMKKASEECGTRLLDVLDIHYYSESARGTAEDRVQSVRTLYEEGFSENSWIGQWCMENVPILPTVQASIDKYYPGTKLAITEYNFKGGDDTSGTIAQAEALGCFADAGVYMASLWGSEPYILAGINLYTNYNGKGGCFGDTLVPASSEDVSKSSTYAAVNKDDDSQVTVMITNKDMKAEENASIQLKNSDKEYKSAAVYAVFGDSEQVRLIDIIKDVKDNNVNVTIPAFSAAMVVVSDKADAFDGEKTYDQIKDVTKTETFTEFDSMVNKNGYIEIPITDAKHLSKIIINGKVTSSAGSSWATAGCAVCINAKDADGKGFWTSKSYSLPLGDKSSATVKFDGTLTRTTGEGDDKVSEDIEAYVADGKVELQKWWDASEKSEDSVKDKIEVEYTSVQVVYEYPEGETPSETSTDKPTEAPAKAFYGDANCDGKINVSDAVAVLQYAANKSKYPLGAEGLINADVDGEAGITGSDALTIQQVDAGLIKQSALPLK